MLPWSRLNYSIDGSYPRAYPRPNRVHQCVARAGMWTTALQTVTDGTMFAWTPTCRDKTRRPPTANTP